MEDGKGIGKLRALTMCQVDRSKNKMKEHNWKAFRNAK